MRSLTTGLEEAEPGFWVSRIRSAVSYPDTGNEWCAGVEGESFWFRHRNRCVVEVVRAHPPTGPIFDIGGGNGFVAIALRDAGLEAVLVEPGPSGARRALERGLRPVVCATMEEAGFKEASLPAAGLFDVLEHQPDEASFLSFLRDRLVPGGRLYVTVPAFGALWSVDDDVAGHYRRYTRSSLTRSLVAAGFRVDAMTYLFSPLPLPVLLFRTLPSLLRMRKARQIAAAGREHEISPGIRGRVLMRMLDAELGRIRRGRSVAIGTTCLAVATRSP